MIYATKIDDYAVTLQLDTGSYYSYISSKVSDDLQLSYEITAKHEARLATGKIETCNKLYKLYVKHTN